MIPWLCGYGKAACASSASRKDTVIYLPGLLRGGSRALGGTQTFFKVFFVPVVVARGDFLKLFQEATPGNSVLLLAVGR